MTMTIPVKSFAWPVPGWTGVSCAFGNGHYGMDIPASRGTQIVASRSGTVMTANGSDDWGYSWGYYVSIYHDSTYSTLYAHMSSVAVSEGPVGQQRAMSSAMSAAIPAIPSVTTATLRSTKTAPV